MNTLFFSRFNRAAGVKAVFLACLLSFSLPANSAENGKLMITTTAADTKRALTGVSITVIARNGSIKTSISGDEGKAILESLPSGLYEVKAEKQGFRVVVEPAVRIAPRKTTPLSLAFQPALQASEQVEEVLVVAKAVEAEASAAVSASVYDREALRSAPGSGSDVLRALDGLPGLISTGDFASFTVRGRGPQDNLIFVDGIPFENVIHFNQTLGEQEEIEGGGRYSIFAPNIIERADYQPGGFESAYGGRSGSLLNLNVASGNPDTASFSTRLDLAGLELTYDGPSHIHEGTSFLLSARQLNFGQFFETIGIKDLGSPKLSDIILKTKSDIDEDNTVKFLAVYAPEEFTRNLDNVLASEDQIDDVSLSSSKQDASLFGITWERFVGDTGELTNKVYYRNIDKTSSQGEAYPDLVSENTPAKDIPIRQDIITVKEQEEELGWRLDYVVGNGLGELRTGFTVADTRANYGSRLTDDWIRFIYDQNDYRPSSDQKYIELKPEYVDNSYSVSAQSYAAYVEQVFEYSTWDFRAGTRFDKDGLSGEELLSPRLGVNWFSSPTLTVSATAGIFYQTPRILDKARDPSNINLKNEKTTQYSLGIDKTLNYQWNVIAETYYQDLENLVVNIDRVSGAANNKGTGESYGLDVVLNRRFTERWSANASYSFNEATIDQHDGLGSLTADYNRPHAFGIAAVWEINNRWKLSGRWKYASGKPTDEYIVNTNVLGSDQPLRFSKEYVTNNTIRFDDYVSLNLRVDYRRSLGFADLIAFLDITNALGNANTNSVGFNERTGEDVENEGNAFPLIGLRFEF